MPRILITGCSSGFGQAILGRFLDENWDVVATMRAPSTEQAYFQSLRSAVEKTEARDVANAVWRAVTDAEAPMMLPAGADAETWFRQEGRAVA